MGRIVILSLSPFLVSLLLLLLFQPESAGADLQSDAVTLQRLLAAVYQGKNLNWSNTSMVCSWKGINCTGANVTALRLPGSNLVGDIPLGIFSNLTALIHVSFRKNRLTGAFPRELFNCTALQSLTLSHNQFSGGLPENPGTVWPRLQRFDVSFNAFNGSLPSWLPRLTRLNVLFLQNNSFEGPLPGIMVNLSDFNVANNSLNGTIPLALQSFLPDRFDGNIYLCGPPLSTSCPLPSLPPPSQALPPPTSSVPPPVSIPPPLSLPTDTTSSNQLPKPAIAGIVAGIVGLVSILVLLFCFFCLAKRKTQQSGTATATVTWIPISLSTAAPTPPVATTSQPVAVVPGGTGLDSQSQQSKSSANNNNSKNISLAQPSPSSQWTDKLVILEGPLFEIEDLLRASAEVLGKGSMGTAYKATLDLEPRRSLMVKRVNLSIAPQQFVDLIDTVHRMRHDNLLPLLAYQHGERSILLIYQYTGLGNLRTLLHGLKDAKTLSLENRCKIALNVARALAYLHSHVTANSTFKYTHGDVKSSNVLLKSDGSVYLSDFGLTHMVAATMAPCRMLGYRAPEVLELRRVTPKSDVYSFGVLLLELLTGKSPEIEPSSAGSDSSSSNDLPWLVRERLSRGNGPVEVFNSDLLEYNSGKEKTKTMEHLLDVAMVCTEPFPDRRPTMAQVVIDLMNFCGLDGSNQLLFMEEEYDGRWLV